MNQTENMVTNVNEAAMTSSPNITWLEPDLFTWHGTEVIFLPLILVLGILGNVIIFYIYHFRWQSNTVTLVKRILAGLDLVSLIFAIPIVLHLAIHQNSSNFVPLCRFSSFIALTTAVASGFVLIIIAVDRFRKLCLLQKHGLSSLQSKKIFLYCLTGSILINLPTCWVFGRDNIDFYIYKVRYPYCFIDTNSNVVLFAVWASVVSIVFCVIMTTLIILYSKIARSLYLLSKKHDELKRRPSIAGGKEFLTKQKQSQAMRTTSFVFIAITIVFFCSYAPYFVTILLSFIDPTIEGGMGPIGKAMYDLCKLAPLINNVANPFIYSFTSDRFRAELIKMVTLRTFKKGIFRRRAFSQSSLGGKSVEPEISQTDSRDG